MRRPLILLIVLAAAAVPAVGHGRPATASRAACAEGRIAYAGSDGMIWVAPANNTAPRRISSISGFSPSWSPDGRQIAFRHIDEGGSSIYVVNADGTSQRRLTIGTSDWSPAWSPDGARIAYSSLRDNRQELVTVAPEGGPTTVLTLNAIGSDVRTFTSSGGRFRAVVRRARARSRPLGPVAAFFAGDSTTLAFVDFRKVAYGRGG